MKLKLLTFKIRKRMIPFSVKSKQNMTTKLRVLKKKKDKFVNNSGLKKINTKTNKKTLDIMTGLRRSKIISDEISREKKEKKTD